MFSQGRLRSGLPVLRLKPLEDSARFLAKQITLCPGERIEIARSSRTKRSTENNGYFDSSIISQRHAEIWAEGDRIFIRDIGSSSGTFLNGNRLSVEDHESSPREMRSGDIVQLGLDWVFTDEKTPYRTVRARVSYALPGLKAGQPRKAVRPRLKLAASTSGHYRAELQRERNVLSFSSLESQRRDEIERQWNRAARKTGAAQLSFINEIDLEELPASIGSSFVYLERSYRFNVAEIISPLLACSCVETGGDCSGPGCGCQSISAAPSGQACIVECNEFCRCPPGCRNRLAQHPRGIPIEIFKTKKRGWGVRAPVAILAGTIVGIYTGLIIGRDDVVHLDTEAHKYSCDLDVLEIPRKKKPRRSYSIDASKCGNWTRFINHSCAPNLEVMPVVWDSTPEDNIPYLIFVARQNIEADVELTFDYSPDHQREWERRKYTEKGREKKMRDKEDTRCFCGSDNCRGWL